MTAQLKENLHKLLGRKENLHKEELPGRKLAEQGDKVHNEYGNDKAEKKYTKLKREWDGNDKVEQEYMKLKHGNDKVVEQEYMKFMKLKREWWENLHKQLTENLRRRCGHIGAN